MAQTEHPKPGDRLFYTFDHTWVTVIDGPRPLPDPTRQVYVRFPSGMTGRVNLLHCTVPVPIR